MGRRIYQCTKPVADYIRRTCADVMRVDKSKKRHESNRCISTQPSGYETYRRCFRDYGSFGFRKFVDSVYS